MSLVPTSVLYSSPGVPLWNDAGSAFNSSNLSWTAFSGQGLTGAYVGTVSNAYTSGITSNSVILANIRFGLSNDPSASWHISTVPSANAISFVVAAQPTAPTQFTISWAVAQY
jgi:hypothetical protein